MSREPDYELMERCWHVLQRFPGARRADVARALGIRVNRLISLLVSMDTRGYLVSEDQAGRLYPFHRNGRR